MSRVNFAYHLTLSTTDATREIRSFKIESLLTLTLFCLLYLFISFISLPYTICFPFWFWLMKKLIQYTLDHIRKRGLSDQYLLFVVIQKKKLKISRLHKIIEYFNQSIKSLLVGNILRIFILFYACCVSIYPKNF